MSKRNNNSGTQIDVAGLWYKLSPLVAMGALLLTIYTRFDNPQRDLELRVALIEQQVKTQEITGNQQLQTLSSRIDANGQKDENLSAEVESMSRKIDQILYALEYNTKPSQAIPTPTIGDLRNSP